MAAAPPSVSVILPLYRSAATLDGCLAALRVQSFCGFEVVMIDSSPDEACAPIAAAYPEFRYERVRERLLPHAARNVGVGHARGELLVFADPDVYAEPDWLARLVAAHRGHGGVAVGALACHGDRWLDRGIHLVKFSKWLPGGAPRPVDMAPTAAMLVARRAYEAVGGFEGDLLLGDTTFSWGLRRLGVTLWLEPGAIGRHHHLDTFAGFLRERWRRGHLFASMRLAWERRGRGRALAWLAATALPLRLASNLAHTLRHASRAGAVAELVITLPIVVLGHAASLAGEALGYARALRRS